MTVDDDGRWFCSHCGRRALRGGFRVSALGKPRHKRLKLDKGDLYCSERCLRDALFGLAPDDDPVEALSRKVRGLEARLNRVRQANLDAQSEDAQIRHAADDMLMAVRSIREQELTRSIANDAQGKQLRRLLDLIARHAEDLRGI